MFPHDWKFKDIYLQLCPSGVFDFTHAAAAAAAAAAAKSLQSCLTLCNPIDGSPPGSPVPGILQARTLQWGAISFSNAWKWKSECEVAQSCSTLSDPMDCNLPGSSVRGIFQARVLEWGAIAFSMISLRIIQFIDKYLDKILGTSCVRVLDPSA